MDLYQGILTRRSVRQFTEQKISHSDIEEIIEPIVVEF